MKISIAMAAYNGARYLDEQLDSIVNQTKRPHELVICDDASDDSTLDIVERFAQQAPFRVRVYRNEKNIGHTKNFEKAIGLCSGDVIFLCDQDDVWLPNKIETLHQYFTPGRPALIQSDAALVDAELRCTGETVLKRIYAAGYSSDKLITGCCAAFTSSLIPIVVPIPDTYSAHDTWVNEIARILGIRMVDERAFTLFRRHTGNASDAASSRVSTGRRVSRVLSHTSRKDTIGWERNLARLKEIERRVSQSCVDLQTKVGEQGVVRATEKLRQEISAQERRLDLASVKRTRRLHRIASLWADGGYKTTAGLRSAIKDSLMPAIRRD